MMFETAFWVTDTVGIAAAVGVTGWIVRHARREAVADRARSGQPLVAAGSAAYAPQKIQPEPENGGWVKGREAKPWEEDLGFWARWDRPESEDGDGVELAQGIPFPRASDDGRGGAA